MQQQEGEVLARRALVLSYVEVPNGRDAILGE
jgi:hypothetical protein